MSAGMRSCPRGGYVKRDVSAQAPSWNSELQRLEATAAVVLECWSEQDNAEVAARCVLSVSTVV